ncbi:MAG: LamG domain-containing protein, partial [Candidatus Paceibacterota bacterium]
MNKKGKNNLLNNSSRHSTTSFYIFFLIIFVSALIIISFSSSKTISAATNNGLVGYWPFDEGVSTIAHDFSGKGNNGTLSGTTLPVWRAGKLGKALYFDGSTSIIPLTIPKSTTMTFSVWASWNGGDTEMLFNAGNTSAGPDLFFIPSPGCGKITWNVWDSCSTPLADIPANATDGKMHHYVVIADAGANNTRIYYDGAYLGSGTYRSPAGSTTLKIGGDSPTYTWGGTIDEFRAYNRALSTTEITELYNQGVTKVGTTNQSSSSFNSGLVGYWSFDEGTSTIAHDFSGKGNNGVFTNISEPPTSSSGWTNGRLGKGMRLYPGNGTGTSTVTMSAIKSLTGNKTVSMWVYPTGSTQAFTVLAEQGSTPAFRLNSYGA